MTTPLTNDPATPTSREYVLRYATDRRVWNLHRPDGTVMMTIPDAQHRADHGTAWAEPHAWRDAGVNVEYMYRLMTTQNSGFAYPAWIDDELAAMHAIIDTVTIRVDNTPADPH